MCKIVGLAVVKIIYYAGASTSGAFDLELGFLVWSWYTCFMYALFRSVFLVVADHSHRSDDSNFPYLHYPPFVAVPDIAMDIVNFPLVLAWLNSLRPHY